MLVAANGRSRGLGAGLKRCREARGFTIRDVAKQAGLSPEAVSAVERGRRYPTLDTVERLATALNVTVVVGPKRTEIFE